MAGDTAQSISQGVGFKFSDLREVFDPKLYDSKFGVEKPHVKQLTTNFRSHTRILELANSVVNCIEMFFPNNIDKLKKEKSNISGPKPIILQEGGEDMLFNLITGE